MYNPDVQVVGYVLAFDIPGDNDDLSCMEQDDLMEKRVFDEMDAAGVDGPMTNGTFAIELTAEAIEKQGGLDAVKAKLDRIAKEVYGTSPA